MLPRPNPDTIGGTWINEDRGPNQHITCTSLGMEVSLLSPVTVMVEFFRQQRVLFVPL